MIVQSEHISEKLQVNLRLRLLNVPCSLISLDYQDELGNHVPDLQEGIQYVRYSNGKEIKDIDIIKTDNEMTETQKNY